MLFAINPVETSPRNFTAFKTLAQAFNGTNTTGATGTTGSGSGDNTGNTSSSKKGKHREGRQRCGADFSEARTL